MRHIIGQSGAAVTPRSCAYASNFGLRAVILHEQMRAHGRRRQEIRTDRMPPLLPCRY